MHQDPLKRCCEYPYRNFTQQTAGSSIENNAQIPKIVYWRLQDPRIHPGCARSIDNCNRGNKYWSLRMLEPLRPCWAAREVRGRVRRRCWWFLALSTQESVGSRLSHRTRGTCTVAREGPCACLLLWPVVVDTLEGYVEGGRGRRI